MMATKKWDGMEVARYLAAHSVSWVAWKFGLRTTNDVPRQIVDSLRLPTCSTAIDAAVVVGLVTGISNFVAWREEQRGWVRKGSLEALRKSGNLENVKFVSNAFVDMEAHSWPMAAVFRDGFRRFCEDDQNAANHRMLAACAGSGLCAATGYEEEWEWFYNSARAAGDEWCGPRDWSGSQTYQMPPQTTHTGSGFSIPNPTTYADQRFRALTGAGSHMGNYEASRIVQQETGIWVERPL